MKIGCLSDLHGDLPKIEQMPKVDVLCIAGDICPDGDWQDQADWLNKDFRDWLLDVPAKRVVGIWGNHDFIGEHLAKVPPELKWDLLHGSSMGLPGGHTVFGNPWTTGLGGWALQKSVGDLEFFLGGLAPCSILLTHTPPFRAGDKLLNGDYIGSKALLKYLSREGAPRLTVTGHIHEARGFYILPDGGIVCNASWVDPYYNTYDLEIPVFNLC